MKRIFLATALFLLFFFCFGCGKKEEFEFADELFIRLQTTPVGMEENFRCYTTYIEIYQDGTVKIYADDFYQWYSEEECPTMTTTITTPEVQTLKQLIREENILSLNEDVGSKDAIQGSRKFLTIFMVDGEFTTGGLSPSNRSFLRVYDYIYEVVAEKIFSYSARIEALQQEGLGRIVKQGIYLTDDRNEMILVEENITDIFTEEVETEKVASYTDFNQTTEETEEFRVVIQVDEEKTSYFAERTEYCENRAQTFFLYVNDKYYLPITVTYNIKDGKIYLNEIYDEETANAVTEELQEAWKK